MSYLKKCLVGTQTDGRTDRSLCENRQQDFLSLTNINFGFLKTGTFYFIHKERGTEQITKA